MQFFELFTFLCQSVVTLIKIARTCFTTTGARPLQLKSRGPRPTGSYFLDVCYHNIHTQDVVTLIYIIHFVHQRKYSIYFLVQRAYT